METDLAVELVLQVAPGELRNQDLVLERTDGESERVAGNGYGDAGNLGDHDAEWPGELL